MKKNQNSFFNSIVLLTIGTFLGIVSAVTFLTLLGYVEFSSQININDIAGPAISAIGVSVTAFVAKATIDNYNKHETRKINQKEEQEKEYRRTAEEREKRQAKLDLALLPHLLSDVLSFCDLNIRRLISIGNQVRNDPRNLSPESLNRSKMPENITQSIREIGYYQRSELLDSLVLFSNIIQIYKSRSQSRIPSILYHCGIRGPYQSRRYSLESAYYGEILDLLRIYAHGDALFRGARETHQDTEDTFLPDWKTFNAALNATDADKDEYLMAYLQPKIKTDEARDSIARF
ncbi:hypothetical protein TH24_10150 [Thalassospira xiamenensis]|nr:hypothetical protein TH24_10150 [Thalassospira xiamenensis]